LYNYQPKGNTVQESGGFSLKKQYAFERLNEKEKDLFEEYQRRINESIVR